MLGVVNSVPLSIAGFYNFTYPNLPDRNAFLLATVVNVVLGTAYFIWFWSGGRRATPGQRAFGIQVANAFDGRPLSVSQAAKRWTGLGFWLAIPFLLPFRALAIPAFLAGCLWWLLVLVTTVVSPTKQGMHDRLAASAVVRPAGVGNRWAVGCLALILILAVLEGFFFALILIDPTVGNLPPGFWDTYMRWLWPS